MNVEGNHAFDEFQYGLLTLAQIRGPPYQLLKVRQFAVEAQACHPTIKVRQEGQVTAFRGEP